MTQRSSVDDRNQSHRCHFCFNFAQFCTCPRFALSLPDAIDTSSFERKAIEATAREVTSL